MILEFKDFDSKEKVTLKSLHHRLKILRDVKNFTGGYKREIGLTYLNSLLTRQVKIAINRIFTKEEKEFLELYWLMKVEENSKPWN